MINYLYKTIIATISLLLINNLAFGSKVSPYGNLAEVAWSLSKNQKNSLYAMHELLFFYKSPYGVDETFCLQTSDTEHENVTVKECIGGGGSKKALLLTDGRVIMFPNTDVDNIIGTAKWWPDAVTKEAAVAHFLEEIDVPALNRKKAYLIIPSKNNSTISYRLPVLLSDSFAQYADRGWFVVDSKNPRSSFYPEGEWRKLWGTDLKSWGKTFDLLIRDLLILSLNGIYPNQDCRNVILVKGEDEAFHLRYFGFDFGGKYGTITPPSEETRLRSKKTSQQICSSVSENAKLIIYEFVWFDVLRRDVWDFKDSAAELIAEHFSSCEFITEIFSNLDVSDYELLEL